MYVQCGYSMPQSHEPSLAVSCTKNITDVPQAMQDQSSTPLNTFTTSLQPFIVPPQTLPTSLGINDTPGPYSFASFPSCPPNTGSYTEFSGGLGTSIATTMNVAAKPFETAEVTVSSSSSVTSTVSSPYTYSPYYHAPFTFDPLPAACYTQQDVFSASSSETPLYLSSCGNESLFSTLPTPTSGPFPLANHSYLQQLNSVQSSDNVSSVATSSIGPLIKPDLGVEISSHPLLTSVGSTNILSCGNVQPPILASNDGNSSPIPLLVAQFQSHCTLEQRDKSTTAVDIAAREVL